MGFNHGFAVSVRSDKTRVIRQIDGVKSGTRGLYRKVCLNRAVWLWIVLNSLLCWAMFSAVGWEGGNLYLIENWNNC